MRRGGAAAMVLANAASGPTMSDNHFLPAVHLEAPQAAQLDAFLLAHPAAVASFPDGVKGVGQGDRMTDFSSRGPGGLYLKPDVTAPGIQILAGNTPASTDVATGPVGELYQALAGTSIVGAGGCRRRAAPEVAPSGLVARPDRVGAGDDRHHQGRATGRHDAGRRVRPRGRPHRPDAGRPPGVTISESAPRFSAHAPIRWPPST